MKKFILLTMLICRLAYSMESETRDQQLKKLEIAVQLLNTPDQMFHFRCPTCGKRGDTDAWGKNYHCNSCHKAFHFRDLDEIIKGQAAHTVILLQNLLPGTYKK